MKTADFDYDLPQERIAQRPVEPRDVARLLVLSRDQGTVQHARFYDLPTYLRPGDLLVCNESRVVPARLYGHKAGTGGQVEVLLLRRLEEQRWQSLVRGRVHPGTQLVLGSAGGPGARARVVEVREDGTRVLAFAEPVGPLLERLGVVPLPPYIHESLDDAERYQTIYARVSGSVAAPTAGLHFTPALIERLQQQEVRFAFVVLHIGLDTFRPVEEEVLEDHAMHAEWCRVPPGAVKAVRQARQAGRRVVAVGTTAVRALEAAAQAAPPADEIAPFEGWTRLFIYPGYHFRVVDALITNFHLPRSTLLMLVSAFAGREQILAAYTQAMAEGYRFYSFGDATLIL